MAGMSRDKCGSAVVAGILQCCAKLKPKGIKVIGAMAMVGKNSCNINFILFAKQITLREQFYSTLLYHISGTKQRRRELLCGR